MIWIYDHHQIPSVSLTSKLFLRKLFRNLNTLFKIIIYCPQSNEINLLVSLHKFMPNDDTEEVVSTDIISV